MSSSQCKMQKFHKKSLLLVHIFDAAIICEADCFSNLFSSISYSIRYNRMMSELDATRAQLAVFFVIILLALDSIK